MGYGMSTPASAHPVVWQSILTCALVFGVLLALSLWVDAAREEEERLRTFRTKPQLAWELITAARSAGVPFRAVVADCAYGDNVNFEAGLWQAGLPYVVSLKQSKGSWAPAGAAHTPEQAARRLRWRDPAHPRDWAPVERRFRDGHGETWWAADLTVTGYGPERLVRLVVAPRTRLHSPRSAPGI
jgi:hypothetical protein